MVTDPTGQTSTTRYTESLAGDLAASINPDGSATLPLATLHGDVVTSIDIPATATTSDPATSVTGWTDYTEYGTSRTSTTSSGTTVGGVLGYGWLGAKQRSTTTDTAGLTLMGDRLYNPTTATFTSTDPEPGGNTTTYTYPQDPINKYDLNGHRWGWAKKSARWVWKNRGTLAAISTLFCSVCATAMAIYSGYKAIQAARRGNWGGAAWSAAGAFGGGRALRGFTAAGQRGARFSGKVYRNRTAAERAAKRYAKRRPHTREYRGTHGRDPDHVHVDVRYGGRIVHTRHYYW